MRLGYRLAVAQIGSRTRDSKSGLFVLFELDGELSSTSAIWPKNHGTTSSPFKGMWSMIL